MSADCVHSIRISTVPKVLLSQWYSKWKNHKIRRGLIGIVFSFDFSISFTRVSVKITSSADNGTFDY